MMMMIALAATSFHSPGILVKRPDIFFRAHVALDQSAFAKAAVTDGAAASFNAYLSLLRCRGPALLYEHAWPLGKVTFLAKACAASVMYSTACALPVILAFVISSILVRVVRLPAVTALPLPIVSLYYCVPAALRGAVLFPASLAEQLGPRAALARSRTLMSRFGNELSFATFSLCLGLLIRSSQWLIARLLLAPLTRRMAPDAAASAPIVALACTLIAVALVAAEWVVFEMGAVFVASLTFYERVAANEGRAIAAT